MRNFDERMDEIRSRSKARIARRKKMISTVCVPLVLCVAVSFAWFAPWNRTADPVVTETTELQYQNTVNVVYITDSTTGEILRKVEDSREFLSFAAGLPPVDMSLQATANELPAYILPKDTNISYDRYSIEVIDPQGNAQMFTYCASTLIDTESGEVYYLNTVDRIKLNEILKLN